MKVVGDGKRGGCQSWGRGGRGRTGNGGFHSDAGSSHLSHTDALQGTGLWPGHRGGLPSANQLPSSSAHSTLFAVVLGCLSYPSSPTVLSCESVGDFSHHVLIAVPS